MTSEYLHRSRFFFFEPFHRHIVQNLSEFRSGPDYDAQYGARYNSEINFLTALAREQNGKILDICCGTGIVTIPLADAGFDICGIDISPEMLAHAKTKATHLNNATFLLYNALDFALRKKFDLAIMTGNAFQAFLNENEVLKVLRNINKHLNKAKKAMISCYAQSCIRWESRWCWLLKKGLKGVVNMVDLSQHWGSCSSRRMTTMSGQTLSVCLVPCWGTINFPLFSDNFAK